MAKPSTVTQSKGTAAGPVIEVIYGPLQGGSETLAFNLCKQWRARGVPVRLCCLYGGKGPMTRLYEEAGVPYDLLELEPLSYYQRWRRLVAYLRHHRPAALHVHHFGFLVNVLPAAYTVGCRNIVYTEHSIFRIMQKTWMRWSVPWGARLVRKMTCVSQTLTAFFRDGMGIPADRITTVYNGVDTEVFTPRDGRAEAVAEPVIGAVGRLVEEKDYPNLLRAIARLKSYGHPFRLRIAGDGILRAQLEALVRDLAVGDRVEFMGGCNDVAGFMKSIDIYVLSSRHEGLPIALMEAMASALPIVSTSVGGVAELIRDGVNGLLVPRHDPRALADALASLLQDARLRRRLGDAACREARARFSIGATAERYAELLDLDMHAADTRACAVD